MDDDSRVQTLVKCGLGALGLGAVAAAIFIPKSGIWIALFILLLALLLFGGYYLWHRAQARHRREQFTSAIEEQTSAVPRAISDPNKRADLDKVRQKFQLGLQEFKSRGKDIYKLPWYVIIGESGSGKTEAIRHSGIDFPPGLQDELQGSGGTVNMDWWFTNRGIILDTAGSMIFNEARTGETPEWREFLRLLSKARPLCPINGLFLVLSVESLIRDSADVIAQKASVLAQQLDLIQRTLDVRFPVYLLVTKCDLLAGFREFFDNIEDPLLQHQIFGWSNPDPLDAAFRPDQIEQHLQTMTERLRRRRLALLRDISAAGRLGGDTQHFFASSYQLGRGPAGARHLDEVDSLFTLPESIMRLAPRLRRYLETIFVAGEWSAKPVFLRGIYFTSSMREGKALDEAIAFATGLSLDQLPEERSWEKNRAFFLRDLFHEKVFRESGLVTRATNTLRLLRQRQLTIFGSAGAALLLLLVFAGFAYHGLKTSVLREAAYWRTGATNWSQNLWSPIVGPGTSSRYNYYGTNLVPGAGKLTLVEFHDRLRQITEKPLRVSWIFKPMAWVNAGAVRDRAKAQRLIFEAGVLRPLIEDTRRKMVGGELPASRNGQLARHSSALLALMELEAAARQPRDHFIANTNSASAVLKPFLDYLMESDVKPDPVLAGVFARTYSRAALKRSDGQWPPADLLGGNTLSNNLAILMGLEKFQLASLKAQTHIREQLKLVNDVADRLESYHVQELKFPDNPNPCGFLTGTLAPLKTNLDASWSALAGSTNFTTGPLTNLTSRYSRLATTAAAASASAFKGPLARLSSRLPVADQAHGLFAEINSKLNELAGQAADPVRESLARRRAFVADLDTNCLARASSNSPLPAYEARWTLYSDACGLAARRVLPDVTDIGSDWTRFENLRKAADSFRTRLVAYDGPYATAVSNACEKIAGNAVLQLKNQFIDQYVSLVVARIRALSDLSHWSPQNLQAATNLLAGVERDLAGAGDKLGSPASTKLKPVGESLLAVSDAVLSHLRFPVLLSADPEKAMTVPEVIELNNLLDAVSVALQQPGWKRFLAGSSRNAAASIEKLSRCQAVTGALVAKGKPARIKVWFEPPAGGDLEMIGRLPYADFTLDSQTKTNLPNLGRLGQAVIGEGAIADGATIEFLRGIDETVPADTWVRRNWLLPRLIREGAARFDSDRNQWRLRIKLNDGVISNVFRVQLESERPLPSPKDWPR